jgi:hypothetical protein
LIDFPSPAFICAASLYFRRIAISLSGFRHRRGQPPCRFSIFADFPPPEYASFIEPFLFADTPFFSIIDADAVSPFFIAAIDYATFFAADRRFSFATPRRQPLYRFDSFRHFRFSPLRRRRI